MLVALKCSSVACACDMQAASEQSKASEKGVEAKYDLEIVQSLIFSGVFISISV